MIQPHLVVGTFALSLYLTCVHLFISFHPLGLGLTLYLSQDRVLGHAQAWAHGHGHARACARVPPRACAHVPPRACARVPPCACARHARACVRVFPDLLHREDLFLQGEYRCCYLQGAPIKGKRKIKRCCKNNICPEIICKIIAKEQFILFLNKWKTNIRRKSYLTFSVCSVFVVGELSVVHCQV